MLGSSGDLIPIVKSALGRRGLATENIGWLDGEARDEAGRLVEALDEVSGAAACAYGFGEPVVHVSGEGLGGRCPELACAGAALIAGRSDHALLAGSTDGSDGPTKAAGGLVDGDSAERAQLAGISVPDALRQSNSNAFLDACSGLIVTGPTQSNVNDVFLAIRAPEAI